MNKDVIYIDVDDDVTAIIGKIKKAKEKIVALVPPKRVGALQSAVNLRLLDRMAKADKKQMVLITSNPGLVALAASSQIPVAKNLQSKPEVAAVPALIVDDGDDIIDGSKIPVGEHAAKTIPVKDNTQTGPRSDVIDGTDLDIDGEAVSTAPVAGVALAGRGLKSKVSKKSKIPDFDIFRKKLIFGITGGVALVALLIWMFVFAPSATVVITASTSPQPVSSPIKLGGTVATNYEQGIVKSISQQEKKDESIEFEATGQKDIGAKAAGTMQLTRTSVSNQPISIPAGTRFTAGSLVFASTEGTTLAGTSIGPSGIVQDSATVAVVATEPGADYNVSARGYAANVGGFSSQGSAMTGGTTQIAKVVSADDIERAQGQLIGQSTDAQKAALKKKFTNGEIVADSSFTVDRGAAVSTPAVDQEAVSGKAKLTIPTTYTVQAAAEADLDEYLKKYLESKLDNDGGQKVYSTSVDKATLSNFRKEGETMFVTLNTTGRIGPKIDEAAIKEQVKGKKYGEVQQSLEMIDGIKEVDTQFSFFWVRTVPGNVDKITVEFKVEDE